MREYRRQHGRAWLSAPAGRAPPTRHVWRGAAHCVSSPHGLWHGPHGPQAGTLALRLVALSAPPRGPLLYAVEGLLLGS